ncbi:L-ascorbate metabolism protein UlaG, beta-lactamase superfamily [Oceanobacillus limi]|uniref:L-ascorbate metabolism protein UlaG, beta-lactamase superfamily n=1 Tax=Oceanobacillus limi TaxID=930131 RepID=A0A1I0FAH0_9BACI|nr:metal-dependent hydrolase [Oceanobacillus limi]SET54820.1 L-ascorbate metabolism protein UlaG, beta-lactamase superfamily [Oceanobacillus limi]
MKILRLGHAMYALKSKEGKTYVIDPFIEMNPGFPQELDNEQFYQSIDGVFLTHGHFDHTSGLNNFLEYNPNLFIVAQYELALILLQQGIKNVLPINLGGSVQLEDVTATMVLAKHTSSYGETENTPVYAGEAAGYIFDFVDDYTLYHTGDTALMYDMKLIQEVYQPEIVIISSSGHFTMGPREAAYALKHLLNVNYAIPSHTFPSTDTAASPQKLENLLQAFPVVENMIARDEELKELLKGMDEVEVITLGYGEETHIEKPR